MKFYALVLVPIALACGPGTGPITANPRMSFTYSPPLAWTWSDVAVAAGGQALTEPQAQSRINSDIEMAVMKAVESYGYSTSGISVKNAVDAQTLQLKILPLYTTNPTCATPDYVPEGLAVTRKCNTTTTINALQAPLYSITGSINVNSPVALYQSQWDNIAMNVWATLTANTGVKFYGPITVS